MDRKYPDAFILIRNPRAETGYSKFWPLEPHPDDFNLEGVAYSLAGLRRYRNNSSTPFTVAQHSILCYYLCPDPKVKLECLLHDVAETVIADWPGPCKFGIPGLREIEERIEAAAAQKFHLTYPWPSAVKTADSQALQIEMKQFMRWDCGISLEGADKNEVNYRLGTLLACDEIRVRNEFLRLAQEAILDRIIG